MFLVSIYIYIYLFIPQTRSIGFQLEVSRMGKCDAGSRVMFSTCFPVSEPRLSAEGWDSLPLSSGDSGSVCCHPLVSESLSLSNHAICCSAGLLSPSPDGSWPCLVSLLSPSHLPVSLLMPGCSTPAPPSYLPFVSLLSPSFSNHAKCCDASCLPLFLVMPDPVLSPSCLRVASLFPI